MTTRMAKAISKNEGNVTEEVARGRELARKKAALALVAAGKLRKQLASLGNRSVDYFSVAQREYVLAQLKLIVGDARDLVHGEKEAEEPESTFPEYEE